MQVLLYTRDLMSQSTIQGHVTAVGHSLKTVADGTQLLAQAAAADLILLDLNALREPLGPLLAQARASREQPLPVWAYGPHVQEDLMQSAEAAGCELVLPRGQFLARLAQLLAQQAPRTT